MDLNLAGKHVLVTGASRGIGYAIAHSFAKEGAEVTLVARSRDATEAAASRIAAETGATTQAIIADLSMEAARDALFHDLPEADILVNNAGAIQSGPLEERSLDDWRTGFDLKVWGYIHLSHLYAPQMMARGHGTIVNIIGMGGRAVRPSYIIGAAGNAALIGFTQALGAATSAHDVRVFGINPSVTRTDRMINRLKDRAAVELADPDRWEDVLDAADFPFGRPAHAGEVADLAVMLSSPRVAYLSGTVVDLDGGGQWAG